MPVGFQPRRASKVQDTNLKRQLRGGIFPIPVCDLDSLSTLRDRSPRLYRARSLVDGVGSREQIARALEQSPSF